MTGAWAGSNLVWQTVRVRWPVFLTLAALFGLFVYLITTTPVVSHSITELNNLDGMRGFDGVEQVAGEESSKISYSWTRAEATLTMRNMPRYAPLEFSLEMSLDRPEKAPPARLEIFLQEDNRPDQSLAVYQFDPNRPGFHRYTFTIPKGNPPGQPGFTLRLASNGFKPGDGRELGVRVSQFEVKALAGWRELFVWPNPYVPAVFLLTTGLLIWCVRLKLDWLEAGLLAGPLLCAAAESAQYMQARSGWLLLAALILGGAALLFNHPELGKWAEIGPILLAVFAIIGFFVASWPAVYDTHFYVDWNRDIQQHGPFGIYANSENLNYPPLIVWLLWLYGLVANPLNLGESFTAVKLFLSLSVPLLVWIVWRWYAFRPGRPERLPAILLMLGISAGAIYNPAVYGQSDAPLMVFLVAAFLFIQARRPYWGAVLLALALLYKLQTVYVAPLLLVLMLKRSGWRKTALATLPALAVGLILALPTFGFSWNEFSAYWNQGQLAGEGQLEYGAFNLLDLLNANEGQVGWIVPLGFVIIGLVYLALLIHIWFGRAREGQVAFACALAILVCFVVGIKIKQHYLYYPLPFLGLAALFNWRLVKPWLWLGGIYTLMLIISPVLSRRGVIFDNFLRWNQLLKDWHPWFEDFLAIAASLTFVYLLVYYGWDWWKSRHTRPAPDNARPLETPELQLTPDKPD